MIISNINKMQEGMLIGDLNSSMYETNDVIVKVKEFDCGEHEKIESCIGRSHIIAIIYGSIKADEEIFTEGMIIELEPSEIIDLVMLEITKLVIVSI